MGLKLQLVITNVMLMVIALGVLELTGKTWNNSASFWVVVFWGVWAVLDYPDKKKKSEDSHVDDA